MIEVKPVQVSEVKTETTIDLNCFKTYIRRFYVQVGSESGTEYLVPYIKSVIRI